MEEESEGVEEEEEASAELDSNASFESTMYDDDE